MADSTSIPNFDAEPAPDATVESAAAPPAHQIGFWQRPDVQNLLPLATSIAFHLGLVVLGFVLAKAIPPMIEVVREQLIVPEAAIVENAAVGGVPNPGLGGDPNLAAAQDADPNVASAQSWADKHSETLTTTLMGGSSDAADSVIGLGVHTGVAGEGAPGIGGASGSSGSLAPFGVPGGGQGVGPKSPFMGISGNARKVVYICDASGSMMSVFWRVRDELHKAVDVLKPIQAFNVIFFSDVDVTALSKKELVMATPDNKRKAFEMSEKMSAAGTTDPLPAIRMAFEQQPELIYVLTDGFDQIVSFDAVVSEFRKLNVGKRVKVNTILIKATNNPELEKVLRTIASENGGQCKVIDRQDM